MFDMRKIKKRSPLKASPLRNPGQSLDEEIFKLLTKDTVSYAALISVFIVLAIMECRKGGRPFVIQ